MIEGSHYNENRTERDDVKEIGLNSGETAFLVKRFEADSPYSPFRFTDKQVFEDHCELLEFLP